MRPGDSFTLTFEIPAYSAPERYLAPVAHYTSVANASKMLSSREIWVTSALHLNDVHELEHGSEFVANWWESNSSAFDPDIVTKIEALLPIAFELFSRDRFFLLSASAELEDVGQFERYGPVSIHLDPSAVLYPRSNRAPFPGSLRFHSLPPAWRAIVYEDADKEQRTKAFFEAVAAHIEKKEHWIPQLNEILTEWFSWWYAHLIAGMKDRRFRSEAEVRYVVMTEPRFEDVRSRVGRYGVTPYVVAENLGRDEDGLPLPVLEVVVSPLAWNASTEAELTAAVAASGAQAEVRLSDIGLR